jgi:regulator of protease activity HflC (stomatin/prohibitin superfamily)
VLPCLENTHIDLNNPYPGLASVLPWITQDIAGIEPLNSIAPSDDILTQQLLNLDQVTAEQAAAFAANNIQDAIAIGTAETQRLAAIAKAKADAAAKAAAEEAARIAAEIKAKAEAAAKAAAEAARKAAAEAKARADALLKRLCGRWCR